MQCTPRPLFSSSSPLITCVLDRVWSVAACARAASSQALEEYLEGGFNEAAVVKQVTNGKNAMSAGPITINSGVTVTVGSGETYTVV